MGSMVTEIITGTWRPASCMARRGAHDRRLEVQRVLCRFDEQQVDTALQQPQGLLAEGVNDLVERHAAGNGDGLGLRSQRSGGKARLVRRVVCGDGFSRQARRRGVNGMHLMLQVVFGKHDACAAEGVGADNVGAGLQVGAVDVAEHVGPREVQMFVATFVVRAAEIGSRERLGLQESPHRTVQNQNALFQ